MQNWLDEHVDSVRQEGTIYAAIGDGRVPFIDARDIAEVVAEILLRPAGHAGKTYVLTGGEAVGYGALAAALTATLARPVKYVQLDEDEARARLEARGLGPELIEGYLALAAYQKAGGPTAEVHGDVPEILGREPRTVRDFVRDYRAEFA